ncbi:MAG: hypothetical protein ABIG92_03765, partial [Candidatus Omnitrophota bacterium]
MEGFTTALSFDYAQDRVLSLSNDPALPTELHRQIVLGNYTIKGKKEKSIFALCGLKPLTLLWQLL